MSKLIVGISDWKIGRGDDVIVTYALGSCVGICLYDKSTGIAGLSHILLPDSTTIVNGKDTRMKFADTAIPDIVDAMRGMGAATSRLTAKIAGGAVMFAASSAQFNIGERNIAAVKKALGALRIPIIASDVGQNYGRTVSFYAQNGDVEVSSMSKGKFII